VLKRTRALLVIGATALLVACSGDNGPTASGGGNQPRVDPGRWSGVSGRLAQSSARFDFSYAGQDETLFKAHLSSTADFSWDVYFSFVAGPAAPLVQENPSGVWAGYACGATLYWRLEAVYTAVQSGIQGPTTVNC